MIRLATEQELISRVFRLINFSTKVRLDTLQVLMTSSLRLGCCSMCTFSLMHSSQLISSSLLILFLSELRLKRNSKNSKSTKLLSKVSYSF